MGNRQAGRSTMAAILIGVANCLCSAPDDCLLRLSTVLHLAGGNGARRTIRKQTIREKEAMPGLQLHSFAAQKPVE